MKTINTPTEGRKADIISSAQAKNKKPDQVRQVEKALVESGKKAGLPRSLASYTSQDGDGDWIVGSNFESGISSMILRGGDWFYRCQHDGSDTPASGGFQEVLANAEIAYTG